MADPIPASPAAASPPAAGAGAGSAGQGATPPPSAPAPPPAPAAAAFTQADIDRVRAEARAEAEKAAKDAAEAAEAERRGEWQKVAEKARAEADSHKAQLAQMQRAMLLRDAAQAAGARDPAMVAKLIDGDIADAAAATAAIGALQKSADYLFGTAAPVAPQTGAAQPPAGAGGQPQMLYGWGPGQKPPSWAGAFARETG